MAVYVDDLVDYGFRDWRRGEWCHMWADTEEELLGVARKIGLELDWVQRRPKDPKYVTHFDLRASKRHMAIKEGGAVHDAV
jgi:hypothetical protein